MAVGPSLPEVVAVVPDYRRAEYLRAVEEVGLARGIDRAIDERSAPLAFQEFQSAFLVPCKPVLVRGYATRWEALDTMRDLRRLVQDHGHRMVPIEIGSMLSRTRSIDCNDSTMKEEMMTLREFVDSFLVSSVERGVWSLADAVSENPTARVAYMAQHAMMSQIPALCLGLSMHPDLCGPSGPSHVNAWVGTGGTRTPLHFDSYDNLLVQLVGVKYVRLYASGFTNQLPVLMGNSKSSSFGLQGNMSTLNCECEDLDESGPYGEKPTFTYAEALLFPGDCLFIPSRVWHYVRSITTSITINYWFDAA
jgi:lysine-specific demethylase 8